MADVAPYVKRLLDLPENEFCADCQKPHPTWASTTFGVFICINCSGIHRNLGTHITLVRSVTLDTWTTQQYKVMKKVGNVRANKYYEAKLNETSGRPSSTDRQSMERFIYDKYVLKLFAADGQPPHISLLMPNVHPNKALNSNHDFSLHIQNLTKSDNSDDNRTEPNSNHNNRHCSRIGSQPKFAIPLNFTNDTQEVKNANSTNDLSSMNDSLSSSDKNISDCFDDKNDHSQNDEIQSYEFNNHKHALDINIQQDNSDSEFAFEIDVDENTKIDYETEKKKVLPKFAKKKDDEQKIDLSGNSQNQSSEIFEKLNHLHDKKEDKITSEKKIENEEELIFINPGIENEEEKNENEIEDHPSSDLQHKESFERTKSLPKFAKKTDNDESTENIQLESQPQSNEVFDKLNHLQDKKKQHHIQRKTKDEKKTENEEELIFINPGVENEEEKNENEIEKQQNSDLQHKESFERTKSLPKFAKKTDNDESTENIQLESQPQSNEVFDKLNHLQDKKKQHHIQRKTKDEKKTENEEELIFINPGIENEEEIILNKSENENKEEQAHHDNEDQSNNDSQNKEPLEKVKSLPKFAKKMDNDESHTQSNEIFDKLNHHHVKKEQHHFHRNTKTEKKTENEEELIFINPGIENEEVDILNKSEIENKEEQVQINNEDQSNINSQNKEPIEKVKSLPKFAKKKENETENNQLENLKPPIEINHHQIQKEKISDKSQKNNEKEEELIFINPGIENEEVQLINDPQNKVPHEKVKLLPKFAKKADNEEISENTELENSQPQSSEVFDKLNHLQDKKPLPQNQKSDKTKEISTKSKKKTEKEEEEIIFINPGIQNEEQQIQTEIKNQPNNNTQHDESLERTKSLPKFAKKTDNEESLENIQMGTQQPQSSEVFDKLNHLQDKKPLTQNQKSDKAKEISTKSKKKTEKEEEELIFINPGIQNEEEQKQNEHENQPNNNMQHDESLERTKSLPKFAKKTDNEESTENIQMGTQQTQSSKIFDKLNHLQDKKPLPQNQKSDKAKENINKSKKKTEKEEEELIFINPGIQNEEQQIQTEIIQRENAELNKSLPKFAKKKGEAEEQTQSGNNEIFSTLSHMKQKTEEPILLKNISKSNIQHKKAEKRKEQNEEELIFINPSAEEFKETEINNNNLNQVLINNNQNNANENTEGQPKKKALPKFAKQNEENAEIQESNNHQKNVDNGLLFEVLSNLK